MRRPFDCIVGLREANNGSGVGLFNQILAGRLGARYVLLDDYALAGGHPLLSIKFEELTLEHREKLTRWLSGPGRHGALSLFLHTLDGSELERQAIRRASVVYCGNDGILRELQTSALRASRRQPDVFVRAFAPSLLPEAYRETCRPGGLEFFSFGMASKVDRDRFRRLGELLSTMADDYRLLCSLAVHQTSDRAALDDAVRFFSACFGERFVFLGTLTDMGVAYFLNGERIFVGFYRGGVRSNNTTFNTAIRYGRRIITNLDADSPPEIRGRPDVLDLDAADAGRLQAFLQERVPPRSDAGPGLFAWDELIAVMLASADHSRSQVA